MLQPGTIPDTEPTIRVGIILPEDRYTSLALHVPPQPQYQLRYSGRTLALENRADIHFRLNRGQIEFTLTGQKTSAPSEVILEPVFEHKEIQPAEGILVKNIISGRDFHWKKYINATYPGSLIIKPNDDRLLLINELPIEQYLMCVATSEMSSACPPALIEAQTIAARSWMLANVEQKHVALTMDVCNDDCCQRYQGSTFLSEQSIAGAKTTYGKVLLYNNSICDARYSKSCGGMMETFDTIWNEPNPPYLKSIADSDTKLPTPAGSLADETEFSKWLSVEPDTFCSPLTIPENVLPRYLGSVDEAGHYFRWQVEVSQQALIQNLLQYHQVKASRINSITVTRRGGSGRAAAIEIEYLDDKNNVFQLTLKSEYAIRQTLHKKFLFSSAFICEPTAGDGFIFKGAGWGHGVGLCQIGALGMALKGYNSEAIVLHYYPGSELTKIY